MKKYPIVKIVEIGKRSKSTKSRKGEYIYVKLDSKHKGKYYKYDKEVPLNEYISIASSNIKYRRGSVREGSKNPDYITKGMKRKKTIDSLINKGVTTKEFPSALNISNKQLNGMIKDLLKERMTEIKETIIKILMQEINMRKLKKRFEYNVSLYDGNGNKLATITHFAKKTPKQVVMDMKRIIKRGMELVDVSPTLAKKLSLMGYIYKHAQNGTIKNAKLSITFRKGK